MTTLFSSIRLEALKRFLKLKNWSLVETDQNLLIYEGPLDDDHHPIKLVLPIHEEFVDTVSIIAKAVRLLSIVDDCPVEDMSQTIMNLGSDFLRQRIITSSNLASIPLTMANRVIHSLRDLVYYSTCLEEDIQPFFAKGRNIGKKFLEKCRFGQTFVGSFGLSLEMPMALPSDGSAQIPFERRILMRIARGMRSIHKAVQEADVALLTNDYKHGFNANLYETMLDLVESVQDSQMEFSFAWSPEYHVPEELKSMPSVRFTPTVLPFLESAAKSLRKSFESQDTTIIGKVIQLRSDSKGEEESEDLDDGRMIIIEWETEKGKTGLIRAFLSPEEYRSACDAHRDGKMISISGKPEKIGKYLILTAPTDFKMH